MNKFELFQEFIKLGPFIRFQTEDTIISGRNRNKFKTLTLFKDYQQKYALGIFSLKLFSYLIDIVPSGYFHSSVVGKADKYTKMLFRAQS